MEGGGGTAFMKHLLCKNEAAGQMSYDITYMWNLKRMIQMNLFTKQEQTSKTNLWVPKGKRGGGRD